MSKLVINQEKQENYMSEEIGRKIDEALKEKNMTQKELAEKAGVTEAAVSPYVKGDREPRSNTLGVIAAALGVTAGFLLGMGVGSVTKDEKVEKFDELKNLILETKNLLSLEQRAELAKILLG